MKIKKLPVILLIVCLCFGLCSCSRTDTGKNEENQIAVPETLGEDLQKDHSLALDYADGFSVDYYKSDNSGEEYKLITVKEEAQYLVVPEGEKTPDDLPEEIIVLSSPQQIYLVASQVMDMFVSIGAMDRLQFSALESDGWYIKEARQAMESGKLLYAGKYSAPDYELILEKGCDLAIENTMIYHSPEVKEKLESFGIPVIVDRSSYESHPLGRTEWVKLYGALTDKEEEAEQAFEEQVKEYQDISVEEDDDQKATVAFFYISSNGDVKVRKSGDYLPKMIEMAGGKYIFSDLGQEDENASSSVTMQMEEFYKNAKDADYIIYNSTIAGELDNVDDLLEKSHLLENMKAVKEDHVYCTSENLYQSTMELGTIISDIHKMLTGDPDMTYLYQLNEP